MERQLGFLRERTGELAVPVRKVAESRLLFLLTAAHAAAQAHIRPHVLQGRLALSHQGRAGAGHRLPGPRCPQARGRRLRLGYRDGRHALALAKRHALDDMTRTEGVELISGSGPQGDLP